MNTDLLQLICFYLFAAVAVIWARLPEDEIAHPLD